MPPIAIRRGRLEQLLDDHPDRHVVLVRGPAGAGKTVLVAQWLRAHGGPCVWLLLDSSHNDPGTLRGHLTSAAAQLIPSSNGDIDTRSVVAGADDGVLWDVLDLLAERSGTTVNVVLDEVDRLQAGGARHLVSRLVESPPAGVRLVLLSRSKPRLGLERARLRDDLLEIGPTALRFQRGEIEALAATWNGSKADAAELEQATMGWAAGLRLAQLEAWAGDAPSSGLREPDWFASEYVREELIDASPPRLRSFLEVTCWLPMLTGPLCAAVAGQRTGSAPPTLPEMEALPLLPIASRPGAFRYPPILTRVLQQEYRRRDPRGATNALAYAAEACRRTSDPMTAIELFLEGGRADQAADVCAELAAGGESALRRVDEVLRQRPETADVSTPRWLPWRIRAAVAAGHVDEAVTLLAQADRANGLDEESGTTDDHGLVVARAVVAEHLGDVTTLLACSNRPIDAAWPARTRRRAELRALCWRVRGLAWSGDVRGARDALGPLEEAAATAAAAAYEAAIEVSLARAWVGWFDGDISSALEALAAVESEGDADHAAELALLAGVVHRERNQLAKATLRLKEASTLASRSAHTVIVALAASELARCHRAAGATMDALELVVSTRSACPDLPPGIDLHLRSTEVSVRLERHDLAGAHSVVRAAPPGVEAQLLAARLALHQAPTRAGALLESVTPCTQRQVVKQLLLRAQLPGLDPAETATALRQAIAAGEPLGLVRIFLDEGPAVCRRLPELALESTDRALGRLAALACQELALAPSPGTTPPVEQLTARELAVLRLLPLRMSNREMAAQMYISVNTLKTHVRAIYRKLGVPHRSAAVRRARALELV